MFAWTDVMFSGAYPAVASYLLLPLYCFYGLSSGFDGSSADFLSLRVP